MSLLSSILIICIRFIFSIYSTMMALVWQQGQHRLNNKNMLSTLWGLLVLSLVWKQGLLVLSLVWQQGHCLYFPWSGSRDYLHLPWSGRRDIACTFLGLEVGTTCTFLGLAVGTLLVLSLVWKQGLLAPSLVRQKGYCLYFPWFYSRDYLHLRFLVLTFLNLYTFVSLTFDYRKYQPQTV